MQSPRANKGMFSRVSQGLGFGRPSKRLQRDSVPAVDSSGVSHTAHLHRRHGTSFRDSSSCIASRSVKVKCSICFGVGIRYLITPNQCCSDCPSDLTQQSCLGICSAAGTSNRLITKCFVTGSQASCRRWKPYGRGGSVPSCPEGPASSCSGRHRGLQGDSTYLKLQHKYQLFICIV